MPLTLPHKVRDRNIQQDFDAIAAELRGSTVFNVKDFGANIGRGTGDDSTAIQAAINKAAVAPVAPLTGGATVYFPPGQYLLSKGLTIPTNQVNLVGAGKTATWLLWTADTGAGTFGIDFQLEPTDPSGFNRLYTYRRLAHMRIQGVDGGGSPPNNMYGVKWSTHLLVQNCLINRWKAALYVFGNHQVCRETDGYENYDGVRFANNADLPFSGDIGDQHFEASSFMNNDNASFVIGDVATDNVRLDRVHGGQCPYFIYCESTGGSWPSAMQDWGFSNVYSESVNQLIYSNDRNILSPHGKIKVRKRSGVGVADSLIHMGSGTLRDADLFLRFDLDTAAANPPAFLQSTGAIVDCTFRGRDIPRAISIDLMPSLANVNSASLDNVEWQYGNSRWRLGVAVGAIARSDALGQYDFTGVVDEVSRVRPALTGDTPAGIATHAAADTYPVAYIVDGRTTASSSGAIAEGAKVQPVSTGKVKTADSNAGTYGIAMAAAAAGSVPVDIGLEKLPPNLALTGDSAPPSGSAGGDLTGTYPNPTVKASVGLTGTPTSPTAAADTNTTQIASTAYVIGQQGTATPQTPGSAAATAGTSKKYTPIDHVHDLPNQGTAFPYMVAGSVTGATLMTQYKLWYEAVAIPYRATITGVAYWVGGVANGNVKASLYDSGGNRVAETTSGAVAQATALTWQKVAFSATYTATPGYYFIALISDSTTSQISTATNGIRPAGTAVQGGFTNPSTITVPTVPIGTVPLMSTY